MANGHSCKFCSSSITNAIENETKLALDSIKDNDLRVPVSE